MLSVAFVTLVASAQTKVEIDGIWYNLVSKAKQAEVTSGGSYSGPITIPATVTYEGVNYSVTSIEGSALSWCSDLESVNIPESVTSIGEYAFEYSSLEFINIPESVTSIAHGTFCGCDRLTSITIPESVTSIGGAAFFGCTILTTVKIPESVTSIGGGAFEGCSGLTTINIPESVTGIDAYTFKECNSLKSIDIPKNTTYLGWEAFSNCHSLTSINIPESVTHIGGCSFFGCTNLTSITIPQGVTHIDERAFANCPELLVVYCYATEIPSTEVPSTEDNPFKDSYPEYATLFVPASALNTYKTTAPWSSFGAIIALDDIDPLNKCATPTISYVDGEVVFACATEGVTIKSEIKGNASGKFEDMKISLIPTYTITAYATKEKYEDSDVATLTLCWIPCNGEHESEETDILTIPAKPVLINTQDGTITVSGLADGTEVTVYSTAGAQLATAESADGTATLNTDLTAGNIAVVKIGEHSIKVAIK